MKKIASENQLRKESDVLCLVLLNWSAPALWTAAEQRTQAQLAGALVNMPQTDNLGAYLPPSYVQKKGTLWRAEAAATKLLVNESLSLDTSFIVPFKSKPDARDMRPLLLNCRGLN